MLWLSQQGVGLDWNKTASFKAGLSVKGCVLPYQLCKCSPETAFLRDKYCTHVLHRKKRGTCSTAGQWGTELPQFNRTWWGGDSGSFPLATLLPQLSLVLVCLALWFRVVWKRSMIILLARRPSLVRKGNEIAGKEKIRVGRCLPQVGSRAYVKTSLTTNSIGWC